jgi:hypothetical protein
MSKPEKIFVFGAGRHAKVVIDDMNPERASLEFAGYEVLGGRETLDSLWERQVCGRCSSSLYKRRTQLD